MRWLLLKDLQILRRSPLLLVLLALYAVVIGVPVGYAVSRAPDKPKVAFLNEVPPGESTFTIGSQTLDASKYAERLFDRIDVVRVRSRREAEEAVRSGRALAALIVPADVTQKLRATLSLVGAGEKPALEVLYSAENPLKRQYVEDTISAQLAEANRALAEELTKTAAKYLGIVLDGGAIPVLGQEVGVLGLKNSAKILRAALADLPRDDPDRPAIEQVVRFAELAGENLALSQPLLSSIASPIDVRTRSLTGGTSSLDGFAVAAALTIALMVVGLLVSAGMLALEREEGAYGRLVRGLVPKTGLVAEKALLGALLAAAVALLLLGLLALFRDVDLGRAPQWLAALALGGLGFAAMGVAVGALTRDVRASSLLAFLLSVPVAALALVPSGSVSSGVGDAVRVVSDLFPFRPALEALDAGLNGTGGLGGALLHLALLALAYSAVARVALRRFG